MFYDNVNDSANFILDKINKKPAVGIILGSGLGNFIDLIKNKIIIPYKDIPHFPHSNVAGHAGNLVIGEIENTTVLVMQGRFHFYEGFTMKQVTYPIYVMKLLGIKELIVTNACGGINKSFSPGDLMLITDYINILGTNPLIGENDERFGVRFPDMSEPYCKELLEKARNVSNKLQISCKEGVYALFSGPCYETAAEIRAYERLGADAVGMSTVPETIVANYLGMRVLGISCITNMATGIATTKHTHEEVMEIAQQSSSKLCTLIEAIISE